MRHGRRGSGRPSLDEVERVLMIPNEPRMLDSNAEGLEIRVKDTGDIRKVSVHGPHVRPRGDYRCEHSEFETRLSVRTLERIARRQGRHFVDEVERSENPDYMLRGIRVFLEEFSIHLADKKILDFGCGAGAFCLNLLRLGATDVAGVEVDAGLLEIAESRLSDYFRSGFSFTRIEYIDGTYHMPFRDSEFDVVWPHAVMEHVLPHQRKHVLEELWRVLKSGGILIIDATPNRLWVREAHTSNLLLVNYLPLSIAAFIARHCSERVPVDQSTERLLERGFRGCTHWEIARLLPDAEWVTRYSRHELSTWMRVWKKPSDTPVKATVKDTYGLLVRAIDPLLRALRIPQTAVLPVHCIVLRKGDSERPTRLAGPHSGLWPLP
jgi:SAM-dependent methyltransferase